MTSRPLSTLREGQTSAKAIGWTQPGTRQLRESLAQQALEAFLNCLSLFICMRPRWGQNTTLQREPDLSMHCALGDRTAA